MSDEDKTIIAPISQVQLGQALKKKAVASLVQYNGSALGKRYILEGEAISIGRSLDADITIGEASVSRLHAKIFTASDQATIEDLGSANGTYLNEQKVLGPMPLNDQDMIRLGVVILKYFASDNIDGMIQDKIYRMATIDAGTQIFNKQYITEAVESEVKTAKSLSRALSLIYFDLDFFKKVNDTYGHNAGDQVLAETAKLVKGAIRKDDILGRYGGEEFIIILPRTDLPTAFELAERIRKISEAHVHTFDMEKNGLKAKVQHRQTMSLGIAQLDAKMHSALELLEAADKKLYQSKQGGRNRTTI